MTEPSPFMILPFAVMLLSIAFAPILIQHHWERHYHRISLGLALIPAACYLFILHRPGPLLHQLHDYVAFIVVIGSLFVVAGGIQFRMRGPATPLRNTLFLFLGSLSANLVGTTGASILLIRPWIHMNRQRFSGFHTAFFIFLIANAGGCLTPIGPPLFLGYLKGIPFWWPLLHCWLPWLLLVALLLVIFYVFDLRSFRRAGPFLRDQESISSPCEFRGALNLAFLAFILAALFVDHPPFLREALMLAAAAGSYLTTSPADRHANQFTFTPIKEVAWLFIGIFITMLPAIDYLQHHAAGFGLRTPMQFYWLTGSLSGVLDNAPTYLAFLASAFGIAHLSLENPVDLHHFLATQAPLLQAISLGAVFFGALTYIGNGPNLMVKSIAASAGVQTPGFLAYLCRYSLPILLPLLALLALLFCTAPPIL